MLAQMPAQIPVMNRKAAVRQRYPGMTNGKIQLRAALAASLQNYGTSGPAIHGANVENEAFGKLDRVEAQTKTLAAAVAANAAAIREFAGAEGRQPEAGGTSEPHKDENRTFMADFHRWAGAQRGYRLWWSALALAVVVPAFFLLGVLVELQFQIVPPLRSERRLEPPHLGQLRPHNRRVRDGSKAGGPRGEVFVRRS